MRIAAANLLGKIISIWLIAIFGIIPLFFLPLTSEFYEFNKVLLTSLSAGTLLILWLIKSILISKFRIRTSKLDIAIFAFAIVNILAASFSIDQYVSIAGWYPRFNHSLIFILSSITLYFVAANNLTSKSVKYSLLSIYVSALILSILGLASYFGVFLPMEFAKTRSWTPISSTNNLGLYLSVTIPLGIYFSLKTYSVSKSFLNYIFPISLIPVILCFCLINTLGSWVVLGSILIFLFLTSGKSLLKQKSFIPLAFVLMISVILASFAYIPGLNTATYGKLIRNNSQTNNSSNLNFPKEVVLPHSTSYSTAVGILRDQNRAILGNGQGTFLFSYTVLKPQSINQTDYWNLRFDQPSSEIMMILSGTGILGLVAFLAIAVLVIKKTIANAQNKSDEKKAALYTAICATGLLIGSLFFVYSASLTLLAFGLMGALSASTSTRIEVSLKKSTRRKSITSEDRLSMAIPALLLVPVVIIFVVLTNFQINSFEAETHFQKSAVATNLNDGAAALQEQIAAIKENGRESTYRKQLVLTDIALARSILQNAQIQSEDGQQTLSQEDQQNVTALVNQAIEQGKIITGYQIDSQNGTSRFNVGNWEALSLVYRSLIGIGQDAEIHALRAQQQAIALDGQNPLLDISLGRTFLALGNIDSAVTSFENSIRKKPDYAVGYVALAEALKNRPDSAARRASVLQTALNLIPADNPVRTDIQKAWEEALAESQANQSDNPQQPQPNPSPEATPEPSTASATP